MRAGGASEGGDQEPRQPSPGASPHDDRNPSPPTGGAPPAGDRIPAKPSGGASRGAATPAEQRCRIEEHSASLGFDRVGVASASPPPEAALFEAWLDRGHHGAMAWLARGAPARLDPSLLMRDVRSIIAGAVRYGPQPAPAARSLSGEVSCYAWGEDYHRVVGAKASALAAFIRTSFDARASEYVDTGPVLERLWAARAGVGWVGKNAMILDRDLGSYVFLAVVLTDLDLPPDEPALDQCGACTLCIEACPTGAIVEPRVVDSRRCLSYHTIELRGSFPSGFREAAGARVFGCDDCQSVCPWNRSGPEPPEAFLPREGTGAPDLLEILAMKVSDYTARFRGSAMKRATWQGLRRNAAVALGNVLAEAPGVAASNPGASADLAGSHAREQGGTGAHPPRPRLTEADRARALSALEAAASDPDPAVAEAARWAFERASRGVSGR